MSKQFTATESIRIPTCMHSSVKIIRTVHFVMLLMMPEEIFVCSDCSSLLPGILFYYVLIRPLGDVATAMSGPLRMV